MARILVAASPVPTEILKTVLAGHELAFAGTLAAAEQLVREQTFDLIVSTVVFDESRMFDFLQLAMSTAKLQSTPFICARMRPTVFGSPETLENIRRTSLALGAAAFLNITDYTDDPRREMRAAIEAYLPTTTSSAPPNH